MFTIGPWPAKKGDLSISLNISRVDGCSFAQKFFPRTLNENENSSLKVKYLTVNLTFDFERVILREGIALTKILRQNILFTVYFRKSTEYVKTIWDLMSLGRNFGAIGWWHFLFDRPNFGWRLFLIPWRVFPLQLTLIRFSLRAFKMMEPTGDRQRWVKKVTSDDSVVMVQLSLTKGCVLKSHLIESVFKSRIHDFCLNI